MLIPHETTTAIVLGLQAIGTMVSIIYGVIRIERRFTKLEVNLENLKERCPNCKKT